MALKYARISARIFGTYFSLLKNDHVNTKRSPHVFSGCTILVTEIVYLIGTFNNVFAHVF